MAQNGKQEGLYLLTELKERIDSLVAQNKDIWKSRNHFINCAIIKTLKEMESNALVKGKGRVEERDNGGSEQGQAGEQEAVVGAAASRHGVDY